MPPLTGLNPFADDVLQQRRAHGATVGRALLPQRLFDLGGGAPPPYQIPMVFPVGGVWSRAGGGWLAGTGRRVCKSGFGMTGRRRIFRRTGGRFHQIQGVFRKSGGALCRTCLVSRGTGVGICKRCLVSCGTRVGVCKTCLVSCGTGVSVCKRCLVSHGTGVGVCKSCLVFRGIGVQFCPPGRRFRGFPGHFRAGRIRLGKPAFVLRAPRVRWRELGRVFPPVEFPACL